MTYREAIRSGFEILNRNWHLVVIQVLGMVFSGLLFLVMVLLPVIIAAAAIGFNVEGLSDVQNLPYTIGNYLTEYLGIILLGIVAFILYLLFVSVIYVYLYGATSGVLAHSIKNPSDRFSLRLFFSEGRRLFWTIFGYLAAVGLLLIALLVIVVIMLIVVFAMADYMNNLDSYLGYFTGIFLMLLSLSVMLFIVTFGLAVTFYGTAILIFHGSGAFASIKESIVYLYEKPASYWLYCVLLVSSVVIIGLLAIMGVSISEVPLIGVFLAIPYQFFTYAVQSYIGLFILSVLFVYYFSTAMDVGMSIQKNDTSVQGDTGQERIHPQ